MTPLRRMYGLLGASQLDKVHWTTSTRLRTLSTSHLHIHLAPSHPTVATGTPSQAITAYSRAPAVSSLRRRPSSTRPPLPFRISVPSSCSHHGGPPVLACTTIVLLLHSSLRLRERSADLRCQLPTFNVLLSSPAILLPCFFHACSNSTTSTRAHPLRQLPAAARLRPPPPSLTSPIPAFQPT